MCTKFYQNRLGFVEDMTKTFWCVFSVHSVVAFIQLCVYVWFVKAGKLYSKHWSLREDAVKTISQTMSETDEKADRDVTLLLLKGAIVAFNRAVRDSVFAVRVHLSLLY